MDPGRPGARLSTCKMGTLKSVCSSWFGLISRDKYEHTHLRVPMNPPERKLAKCTSVHWLLPECPRKSVSAERSCRLKNQTLQVQVQNLTWKNSKKPLSISVFYSFWQWPKCLKKKNLLRKFSKIWYCRMVPFQVWKSGLSRNFLAKVTSDPKLNKSN